MQAGGEVMTLSIATVERWTDKSGERKERTEWHKVVVFAECIIKRYRERLRKGDLISIEGQIQTRKWQDADNKDRYSTEIVVQNGAGHLMGEPARSAGSPGTTHGSGGIAGAPPAELDDDVPF